MRQLRPHPRRHRPDQPALEDLRRHPRTPTHRALLLPVLRLHGARRRVPRRQAGMAQPRPQLREELDQRGGVARPGDHARSRLGSRASNRRPWSRQAHLCLVRRRYRLPVGLPRVGPASGRRRAMAPLVVQPRQPSRLLHRQGQHPVPLSVLACAAHGVRP